MLVTIFCWMLDILLILILARVVSSWLNTRYDSIGDRIKYQLYRITEPIFFPLKAVIRPFRIGGMALDFSPAIMMFIIFAIRTRVC